MLNAVFSNAEICDEIPQAGIIVVKVVNTIVRLEALIKILFSITFRKSSNPIFAILNFRIKVCALSVIHCTCLPVVPL